jgi:hypothetical protein
MTTIKQLESTLEDVKAHAKDNGKDIDFLKLHKESGKYCLAKFFTGGGYHQYSSFLSANDMMIYLAGMSKGLVIK